MERIKEVKVLYVTYKCPKCGDGTMNFVSASGPNYLMHNCSNNNCDMRIGFERRYPHIRYEGVEAKKFEAGEQDNELIYFPI